MTTAMPRGPRVVDAMHGRRASLLARLAARGDLGRLGESLAARHLRREGYRVVARNVRMQHGELDLVARRKDMLVIVEVRTRRAGSPVPPELTVTRTKQRHLVSAAAELVLRWRLRGVYLRFDVIAIEVGANNRVVRFEHYERAFDPPR